MNALPHLRNYGKGDLKSAPIRFLSDKEMGGRAGAEGRAARRSERVKRSMQVSANVTHPAGNSRCSRMRRPEGSRLGTAAGAQRDAVPAAPERGEAAPGCFCTPFTAHEVLRAPGRGGD